MPCSDTMKDSAPHPWLRQLTDNVPHHWCHELPQAASMLTLLKGAGPALWLLLAAQVRHAAPGITRVRP